MTTDDVVEIGPGTATGGRRRRVGAVAAVLAVLAAGGGVANWVVSRDGGTAAGAGAGLSCPATVASSEFGSTASDYSDAARVPAPPTASGTDGRLVPDREPQSVVLCEYDTVAPDVAYPTRAPDTSTSDTDPGAGPDTSTSDGDPTGGAVVPGVAGLGRTASLDGTDASAADLLAALQDATVLKSGEYFSCGGYHAEGATWNPHLIGLTYDDGVVWVATSYGCSGSTNGVTSSPSDIQTAVVATLYEVVGGVVVAPAPPTGIPDPASVEPVPGTVPTSASGGPGAGGAEPGSSGDLDPSGTATDDPLATCLAVDAPGSGSPDVFVPFTPTRVQVCHAGVDPAAGAPTVTDEPAEVAAGLVAALTALPVLAPDTACTAIAGERWPLLFTDADGASEQVLVDAGGCGTASNGARIAQVDAAFLARLTALG